MRKVDEIADPNSCLNQAEDKETVFTIRAHDPLGPEIVEHWAWWSFQERIHLDRIEDAYECARQMRAWQEAQGIR